jgi:hypothetical protein
MARLPDRREHQARLPVLVLDARHGLVVELGDVHRQLALRVRVQLEPDLVRKRPALRGSGAGRHQHRHARPLPRGKHVRLRERELEHRVVRDVAPVDQLVDDVAVDAERQHVGDRLHVPERPGRQALELGKTSEILDSEEPE